VYLSLLPGGDTASLQWLCALSSLPGGDTASQQWLCTLVSSQEVIQPHYSGCVPSLVGERPGD